MILLVIGLALWIAAHVFKRVAPGRRAELQVRMGDASKGIFGVAIIASIVLMTIGYKAADGPFWWGRSPMTTGINNLLMLVAFYLYAASGMKTRITRAIRHPQLTGFSAWAVGHLLVNGDPASLVLFGGLLLWALAEIALINAAEPEWHPPVPAPMGKEIGAVVGAVVVMAVVGLIHGWVGPWPFGG